LGKRRRLKFIRGVRISRGKTWSEGRKESYYPLREARNQGLEKTPCSKYYRAERQKVPEVHPFFGEKGSVLGIISWVRHGGSKVLK